MATLTIGLIHDGMTKPFVIARTLTNGDVLELRGRYRPRTMLELDEWRVKTIAAKDSTVVRAGLLAPRVVEWSIAEAPPTPETLAKLPPTFFDELEAVVNGYAFTAAEADEKKSASPHG